MSDSGDGFRFLFLAVITTDALPKAILRLPVSQNLIEAS
jgi:hypothetical protein